MSASRVVHFSRLISQSSRSFFSTSSTPSSSSSSSSFSSSSFSSSSFSTPFHPTLFAGRTAFITGASRGIGYACAQALIQHGARVIIMSRDEKCINHAVHTLQQHGEIHGITCDISSSHAVTTTFNHAISTYGCDIFINAAGINHDGLLMKIKDSTIDSLLHTNIYGALYTSRAVLPHMIRNKYGRIIHIGSVIAKIGNSGQVVYGASKAAIEGLTTSLSHEVCSRGITVNCIHPGYIDTEMTAGLNDDVKEAIRQRIGVGRFGKPEDVANLILYLCSPHASYITGQSIVMDGGLK